MKFPFQSPSHPVSAASGFSLAEVLIALALMGTITLSISNFLVKNNASSSTMSSRTKEAGDVQGVLAGIVQDLKQGAYISDNSSNSRLEYTTYDSAGNAFKMIYQVVTVSSVSYLQLSTDGGATWDSPYGQAPYTAYRFKTTPKFLYASATNNCTDFVDTNANGVWQSGVDAAGAYTQNSTCGSGTNDSDANNAEDEGSALALPSLATKVILRNFQMSTGAGSPEAIRNLPMNFFIATPPGPVRSNAAAVAPAAKDNILVQSFDTRTVNSLFGTAFNVRAAAWDPNREFLALVGRKSTGGNTIYLTDRRGIIIGPSIGLTTSDPNIAADGVAIEGDGKTAIVLDAAALKIYRYDLTAPAPLTPQTSMTLAGLTNPTGVAYDPNTPDDFYLLCTSGGAEKILEINKLSGANVANWTIPAGIATADRTGFSIEPYNGTFIIMKNNVSGSNPNKLITLYTMTRAGVSNNFTFNVSDLGSSATGATGKFNIAYDPEFNWLFLTSAADDKVFVVVPPLVLSPRS